MTEYIIQAAEWAIDKNGNSLYQGCEEIVRCKNCKYYDQDEDDEPSDIYLYCYWCDKLSYYMPADGFCSFGDRKEGGDDTEIN